MRGVSNPKGLRMPATFRIPVILIVIVGTLMLWERFLYQRFGFFPRIACYRYNTTLVTLLVIANGIIAVSFYSIPLILLFLARKYRIVPTYMFQWMFALVIALSGMTYVMDIVTIWLPCYWLDLIIRLSTAVASAMTVLTLANFVMGKHYDENTEVS